MTDRFYFGCVGRVGHYMHDMDLKNVDIFGPCLPPWDYVDGVLQPGCTFEGGRWKSPGKQPEGLAAIRHKEGWTALSFWDRSVDMRGNSSSTFFFKGTHRFSTMCALAEKHFPGVWVRFSFEVRLADEYGREVTSHLSAVDLSHLSDKELKKFREQVGFWAFGPRGCNEGHDTLGDLLDKEIERRADD